MDTVIQRNRNTNRWVIDPLAFITPEFSAAVRAINPFICHSKIPGPFTRKVNGPGFLRKARSELLSSLPCAPWTPSQSDRRDSPGRRKQLRILRDSCREPGDGGWRRTGWKTMYTVCRERLNCCHVAWRLSKRTPTPMPAQMDGDTNTRYGERDVGIELSATVNLWSATEIIGTKSICTFTGFGK